MGSGFAARTARLTKGGSIFGSGAGRSRGLRAGFRNRRRRGRFPRVPAWKRGLDLAVIALALPLWGPVALVLAAWVKIVSPGPVFYRQERIGFMGRRFALWKFRSMRADADERTQGDYVAGLIRGDAPLTKLDAADERLIPGARIVRGLGLDELPQIWNVLRGEMSLVGPRPCTPREHASCEGVAEARAGLLPGITGYWQVNGKNRTTFRRMLELDRAYGREMSPWLDLEILLRTLPAVAGQVLESKPPAPSAMQTQGAGS